MGSEFLVYLRLGFEHIADLRGYDHILFIVVLTAMYPPRAWRRVVVLVTAFTVGHSLTLALATLGRVRADAAWVEFLIPVTIVVTAALNVGEVAWGRRHGDGAARLRGLERLRDDGGRRRGAPEPAGTGAGSPAKVPGGGGDFEPRSGRLAKYVLALGFGLIHGLGFSTFLRAALGGEASLALPLFAFNVGVEVGQLAIVASVVAATWLVTEVAGLPRGRWTLLLSAGTGLAALALAAGRLPV